MASPGWYPDPRDPSWHQYYDGHRWTGDRRPANAPYPQTAPLTAYQPQPWNQPQPPAQPWEQQPWSQPWASPPTRRRTRVALIVGLVAALAAGLSVGGYFLFRGSSSPTFTFDGKAIDLPDEPLQQTAAVVGSLVSSRHGAQSKDTRCYYAQRARPTQGAEKSDV